MKSRKFFLDRYDIARQRQRSRQRRHQQLVEGERGPLKTAADSRHDEKAADNRRVFDRYHYLIVLASLLPSDR